MKPLHTALLLGASTLAFALGRSTGLAAARQDDPQAMEAAWEAMGRTGKMHALLEPFVGTWNADAVFVMPDGSRLSTTGTMKNTWIMEGKILQQQFDGSFQDAPFHGLGLWGFSNADEEYQSLWIDSMNTHMDFQRGHVVSADGKTFTSRSKMSMGPGAKVDVVDVVTVKGPNEHVFTRSVETPSGLQESMVITYTR